MLLDQFEVLARDIVLILLHLGEGLLVVVHQFVNVFVLAFFNLVDFDFHPQVQLSLQLLQLDFVVLNEGLFLVVEVCLQVFDFLLQFVLFALDFSDVRLFIDNVLRLALTLVVKVVLFSFGVVLFFPPHIGVGVLLDGAA